MKEGSLVELECGVENVPAPPAYIYWYKVKENFYHCCFFHVNFETFQYIGENEALF